MATKLPMISEILDLAANEFLSSDKFIRRESGRTLRVRCCYAVSNALNRAGISHEEYIMLNAAVPRFLAELGMPQLRAFDEFTEGEERQQVRYCWLMFASMIAEEGI